MTQIQQQCPRWTRRLLNSLLGRKKAYVAIVSRRQTTRAVKAAKLALIWELRKQNVFLLEKGALDDYYPATITGNDKPSRAQNFRASLDTKEKVIAACPAQTCPTTRQTRPEFDFICSTIFGNP